MINKIQGWNTYLPIVLVFVAGRPSSDINEFPFCPDMNSDININTYFHGSSILASSSQYSLVALVDKSNCWEMQFLYKILPGTTLVASLFTCENEQEGELQESCRRSWKRRGFTFLGGTQVAAAGVKFASLNNWIWHLWSSTRIQTVTKKEYKVWDSPQCLDFHDCPDCHDDGITMIMTMPR